MVAAARSLAHTVPLFHHHPPPPPPRRGYFYHVRGKSTRHLSRVCPFVSRPLIPARFINVSAGQTRIRPTLIGHVESLDATRTRPPTPLANPVRDLTDRPRKNLRWIFLSLFSGFARFVIAGDQRLGSCIYHLVVLAACSHRAIGIAFVASSFVYM